jgi:hypothetical protein
VGGGGVRALLALLRRLWAALGEGDDDVDDEGLW